MTQNADRPRGRFDEPNGDSTQGGLSGSGFADQPHDLISFDRKRGVVYGDVFGTLEHAANIELFADVGKLQDEVVLGFELIRFHGVTFE
ncbi:hypothetical protein D9M72_586650 [compost metagenome]